MINLLLLHLKEDENLLLDYKNSQDNYKKQYGKNYKRYILEDVNLKDGTITVKEKRGNKPRVMSIDSALNTFKFIVGYFDSDLKVAKKVKDN